MINFWLTKPVYNSDYGFGSCDSLNLYPTSQYVSNEISESLLDYLYSNDIFYLLNHKNIIKGTLCGSISLNNEFIQTFMVESNGDVIFNNIGNPKCKAIGLQLCLDKGILTLNWDGIRNPIPKLVVCYEYNLEM